MNIENRKVNGGENNREAKNYRRIKETEPHEQRGNLSNRSSQFPQMGCLFEVDTGCFTLLEVVFSAKSGKIFCWNPLLPCPIITII